VVIFHSGTNLNKFNEIVTDGGRVLSVTSLGNTIQAAIIKSYFNVEKITWGNNYQQYRKDIAQKAK
jgi:phosphoribosylamine---glycine ligase